MRRSVIVKFGLGWRSDIILPQATACMSSDLQVDLFLSNKERCARFPPSVQLFLFSSYETIQPAWCPSTRIKNLELIGCEQCSIDLHLLDCHARPELREQCKKGIEICDGGNEKDRTMIRRHRIQINRFQDGTSKFQISFR